MARAPFVDPFGTGTKTGGRKAFVDPFDPSTTTPAEMNTGAPSRGLPADIISQTGAGLAIETPQIFARALRGAGKFIDKPGGVDVVRDVTEAIATPVIEKTKAMERWDMFRPSKESEESYARRSITGAFRMISPSLSARLPGMAIGALAGGVAGSGGSPVGTFAGIVAGAGLGGGAVFGAAEYDRFIEEAEEQGLLEKLGPDARKIIRSEALKSAAVEGGMEAVANMLETAVFGAGLVVGAPLKAGVKKTITNIIKTPLKSHLRAFGVSGIIEPLTEYTQEEWEADIRRDIGMEAPPPGVAGKAVIGPAFVMSLLFGTGMSSYTAYQQHKIKNILSNPNADIEDKVKASNEVYNIIKRNNPEHAETWKKGATAYIKLNKPIPLDMDIDKIEKMAETFRAGKEKEAKSKEPVDLTTGAGIAQPDVKQDASQPVNLLEPGAPIPGEIKPVTEVGRPQFEEGIPQDRLISGEEAFDGTTEQIKAFIDEFGKAGEAYLIPELNRVISERATSEGVEADDLDEFIDDFTTRVRQFGEDPAAVSGIFNDLIDEYGTGEEVAPAEKITKPEVKAEDLGMDEQEFKDLISEVEQEGQVVEKKPEPKKIVKAVVSHEEYNKPRLEWMEELVKIGEPGRRFQETDLETGERGKWRGIKSSYPDWFKDKNLTKKRALTIINKAIKGEELQESQIETLKDLYESSEGSWDKYSAGEFEAQDIGEFIKDVDLSQGDTITIELEGETHDLEITNIDKDGIYTLANGVTLKVDPSGFLTEPVQGKILEVKKGEGKELTPYQEEKIVPIDRKGLLDRIKRGGEYLTNKDNIEEMIKKHGEFVVGIKDVNGHRALMNASAFAAQMKKQEFSDRVRSVWIKVDEPLKEPQIPEGFMAELKEGKQVEGEGEPAKIGELEDIEGITLTNNSTVSHRGQKKFVDMIHNNKIRKLLKDQGIEEVIIEPPHKFSLSEEANINKKTHTIRINADAKDPSNSILHELGHVEYDKLTEEQKEAFKKEILTTKEKYRKESLAGYIRNDRWEEVFSDDYAFKHSDNPDVARLSQVIDILRFGPSSFDLIEGKPVPKPAVTKKVAELQKELETLKESFLKIPEEKPEKKKKPTQPDMLGPGDVPLEKIPAEQAPETPLEAAQKKSKERKEEKEFKEKQEKLPEYTDAETKRLMAIGEGLMKGEKGAVIKLRQVVKDIGVGKVKHFIGNKFPTITEKYKTIKAEVDVIYKEGGFTAGEVFKEIVEEKKPWSKEKVKKAWLAGEELPDNVREQWGIPSEAQIAAGNYKKKHITISGMEISIETEKGQLRVSKAKAKERWISEMKSDYGHILGTKGKDGDPLDVFVMDNTSEDFDDTVFIINQANTETGKFDEHKIMLGYVNKVQARARYLENYDKDIRGQLIMSIEPLSIDTFKKWIKDDTTREFTQEDRRRLAEEIEPTVEPTIEKQSAYGKIADWVVDNFTKGQSFNAIKLQQISKEAFGGTLAEGKFDRKDMYDAMEMGVNKWILQNKEALLDLNQVADTAVNAVKAFKGIIQKLPTQSVRTEEMEEYQQFSTPPDYAYILNWIANISEKDTVLEPSAGTGSIAVFAKKTGAEVIVNELSERRASILKELGFETYQENAEQLNNILGDKISPTVVVMNPPFTSTAGRVKGERSSVNAAKHVEQAIAMLKPGGRLVALVGEGFTRKVPKLNDFWKRISEYASIRGNILITGKGYTKYGTAYENRVLVIDKALGLPAVEAQTVDDISKVVEIFKEVRDDRAAVEDRRIEPTGAKPVVAGVTEEGGIGARPEQFVRPPTYELGTARKEGEAPQPEPRGAAEVPGVDVSGRRSEEGAAKPAADTAETSGTAISRDEITRRSVPEDAVKFEKLKGISELDDLFGPKKDTLKESETPYGEGIDEKLYEKAKPALVAAHADFLAKTPNGTMKDFIRSVLNRYKGSNINITPYLIRFNSEAKAPELTDSVFEPYKPKRISIPGAKEHPGKLVESAAMSAVLPPVVTYEHSLPQSVITEGKLSIAQLEAIIYAGQAHQQMLPNGERKGVFIGDGTGVGKGREGAGIILDNKAQGRKKAIWFSQNSKLVADARRDMQGVGGREDEIFELSKTKLGKKVVNNTGTMFVTYSTMYQGLISDSTGKLSQSARKPTNRLDQIIEWFGADYDGVILFDEAHAMRNTVAKLGGKPSLTGTVGEELRKRLPKARVVYISATGATEVENLSYLDRLGLWGEGTPFANRGAFINSIQDGGIAAMEKVASDMKAMGLYTARSLSYDDVIYDRVEHKLTEDQRAIYNRLAEAWQVVLKNIDAAVETTDANARAKMFIYSRFWSTHQRFFNQVLTSLQMPSVIEDADAQLATGNAVVIQLVNTNEAIQNRQIAEMKDTDDLEDMDLTPRENLMQYLNRAFPTQQYEAYTDENGKEQSRPVVDSEGNPVINREAQAMKDQLMSDVASIKVPEGPLEIILNHWGTKGVAELTGRTQRVVWGRDERGKKKKIVERWSSTKSRSDAEAFMDDKKQVLVFSYSGGVGASYQADLTRINQRQRIHYLAQPGWRADMAIQGLGRTHRTNQKSAPVYKLVTTDITGQKRFISSIARRLDQLGALSKGQRQTASQGLFNAADNLESRYASNALHRFLMDLHHKQIKGMNFEEVTSAMGLRNLIGEDGALNINNLPNLPRFLNRLLSLQIDMMNNVFDEFYERLKTNVDRAIAEGTLDMGIETFKSDGLIVNQEDVVHTHNSGAETKYLALTAKHKIEKIPFDDIVTSFFQPAKARNRLFGFFRNKKSGKIWAVRGIGNKSKDDGRIVEEFLFRGPLEHHYNYREAKDFRVGPEDYKNWEKVKDKEAETYWETESANAPDFREEKVHLVTGALLPIWDRLPTDFARVYRVQTDDGTRYIGRLIPTDLLDATLKNLGASPAAKTTPTEVVGILDQGGVIRLANGWRLKTRTVAGERRIELHGELWGHEKTLEKYGLFTEKISYKARWFVPSDRASEVLTNLFNDKPIADIEIEPSGAMEATVPYKEPEGELIESVLQYKYGKDKNNLEIAKKAIINLSATERMGGVRTLGLGITADIVKKGYINLRGQTAETPKQIAVIAQIYRDPQFETLRYIYTKNGKIVAHEGRTSRMPGEAQAFVKSPTREVWEMQNRMRRLGADGVWFIHNHPTGDPTPTTEDLGITAKLFLGDAGLQIRGLGNKFKGHIVINSGKYAFIKPTKTQVEVDMLPLKTDDAILRPFIEHELLGQQMNDADQVINLGKALQTEKGFITIMFRNNKGKIRALQEVPMGTLNHVKHATDYIRGRAREFGSSTAIIAISGKDSYSAQQLETLRTLIGTGVLLDVVHGTESFRTQGKARRGEITAKSWMGKPIKAEAVKEPPSEYIADIAENFDPDKDAWEYLDKWMGDRDWQERLNTNEAHALQERIKSLAGEKRFGEESKKIDQALLIYNSIVVNSDKVMELYPNLDEDKQELIDYAREKAKDPEFIRLYDDMRNSYDQAHIRANQAGVINQHLQNFFARYWDLGPASMTEAIRKFGTSTRHAKRRVFETIFDGWVEGRELKIQGASNTLNIYKDEVLRAVIDKQLMLVWSKAKGYDNEPLISDQPLFGYKQVEHPNFKMSKWVGRVEEGKVYAQGIFMDPKGNLFMRKPMYAPEKIADRLNVVLGGSKLMQVGWIKSLTRFNAIAKMILLTTSLFHHQAFIRSYIFGTRGISKYGTRKMKTWNVIKAYREGLKSIHAQQWEIELLIKNGLTLGRQQEWQENIWEQEGGAIMKIIDRNTTSKVIKDKLVTLMKRQTDWLFGRFGAGLKAQAALIELKNHMKENPELSEEQAAKEVAGLINADFGGLHLQRLGRNPTTQHIMRMLMLAPDWTESNVRTMIGAIKGGTKTERALYRKFWASVVTKALTITFLVNLLIGLGDDDDSLERFKKAWAAGHFRWLDVDITPIYKLLGGETEKRKYFSIVGHFRDPLKFITHPMRSAHHKGSVIYRAFHEAFAGVDWKGHPYTGFDEFLGIDEKGVYLNTTKTHMKGEPKGGRVAGQLTKFGFGGGPIGFAQIPSYLMAQVRGIQPIFVQQILGWASGEIDAFDAILRGVGAKSGSTYYTPKTLAEEWANDYLNAKENKDRERMRSILQKAKDYNRRMIAQGKKGEVINFLKTIQRINKIRVLEQRG